MEQRPLGKQAARAVRGGIALLGKEARRREATCSWYTWIREMRVFVYVKVQDSRAKPDMKGGHSGFPPRGKEQKVNNVNQMRPGRLASFPVQPLPFCWTLYVTVKKTVEPEPGESKHTPSCSLLSRFSSTRGRGLPEHERGRLSAPFRPCPGLKLRCDEAPWRGTLQVISDPMDKRGARLVRASRFDICLYNLSVSVGWFVVFSLRYRIWIRWKALHRSLYKLRCC